MFDRILLPLDGSDLAEAVLPYGEELARKIGSELVLFHACDTTHKISHGMHHLYLEKRAEMVRQSLNLGKGNGGAVVSIDHRFGDFLTSLSDSVKNHNADLVIMVAHGFTSPLKASVVDDVARLVRCPTLLVRQDCQKDEGCGLINRVLVPLDGTPYSQQILAVARPLVSALDAELVLFSAARQAGYSAAAIEDQKKELEHYLEGVVKSLEGLKVTIKVGEATDFAVAIDEAASEVKADMVMMVTNSPVMEWAESSVARKLLNKGASSLLVMRRR